jgi:hypothetical protein
MHTKFDENFCIITITQNEFDLVDWVSLSTIIIIIAVITDNNSHTNFGEISK